MRVLFVCTANTCRSPMLEQMFRQYAFARGIKDIEIDSAGLASREGDTLNPYCSSVLERHGVPYFIARQAKLLDKKAVKGANLIYTMDDEQAEIVRETYGVKRKVKSLSTLCGGGVLDPYGYDEGAYEDTYSLFLSILPTLFSEVTKEKK
mgnify:FL=1